VEEMNEALISNYNSVVGKDDLCYFIGDAFFCGVEDAKAILSRLNGKKVLVRGNHDQDPNKMYRMGFDVVLESARIRVGKTHVNLSHYPYQRTPWSHYWKALTQKKYRRKLHFKKLKNDGSWLLHGHTHSTEQVKNRMIHVGVDAWNFTPVSITRIAEIINKELLNVHPHRSPRPLQNIQSAPSKTS
jgi:calcineurin-like phosphoesterase family protein